MNIDIEGMDASQRINLNLFTVEVAALVPEVVLATPAIDWSNAYDYDTLADISDAFLMGYDFHRSGGDPGPVDLLYGRSPWSQWSPDWSVQDYLPRGSQKTNLFGNGTHVGGTPNSMCPALHRAMAVRPHDNVKRRSRGQPEWRTLFDSVT